jgi:anti-anti-sigma factor
LSNHFSLSSTRRGDAATLQCAGELDIAAAPAVEEALNDLFSDPPGHLELDWSRLTFMDSTGIRMLLMTVKRSSAGGVDLIWRLSDAAQRALDAVGIHDGLLRQLGEETGREK